MKLLRISENLLQHVVLLKFQYFKNSSVFSSLFPNIWNFFDDNKLEYRKTILIHKKQYLFMFFKRNHLKYMNFLIVTKT